MKIKYALYTCCLLSIFCFFQASAQTESATVKMQKMMRNIIQQVPDEFKKLKGSEVSRNEKAIIYKVDLTKTITDPKEMKTALATDFFGSMLTSEDYIAETGGSTIYLARYADVDILELMGKAFIDLPNFLAMGTDAKVDELKSDIIGTHIYILTIKGVSIGRLDYDGLNGKGQLIIGIKK